MLTIIKECKKKTVKQKIDEKVYIKKCWNCKSKFTYQKEDIETTLGFPPDIWEEVSCPVCNSCNCVNFKIRYFGGKSEK